MAQHFRCAICQGEFSAKNVNVDHTIAIGKGLDWNQFIDRLFCEIDNLQVVCIPCHKTKSLKEREKDEAKFGSGTSKRKRNV